MCSFLLCSYKKKKKPTVIGFLRHHMVLHATILLSVIVFLQAKHTISRQSKRARLTSYGWQSTQVIPENKRGLNLLLGVPCPPSLLSLIGSPSLQTFASPPHAPITQLNISVWLHVSEGGGQRCCVIGGEVCGADLHV